ncbi:MAG: hypothetical protein GJU73_05265 [Ferrovum sp.]|jgi:phage terminase large subunit-like protein|uniref:hypothetical protein n=1 Tax=Ferrovum sp. TaxID=2609467 RepID=UPI0026281DF1|nr:hypothetical protein [Ferrovum sp.]MBW8066838.1 hypothetical protein [Ferrovum sp.]
MPQITLPTLHKGQIEALYTPSARFKVIRCGRRWGKTLSGASLACDFAARGKSFGIFAPDYRILSETYHEIEEILTPITIGSNKVEGVIRCQNKGRVDFWTLNNPRAGRSRKYHGVMLDEVAFAGEDMMDIWTKAIKPSLLDYKGGAIAFSTPAGLDHDNFFYRICTDKTLGWTEYHAPTWTNPHLPQDEIAKLRDENFPLVFAQEYGAEFVSWEGASFFPESSLLVDGVPVEYPDKVDQVFAVVDSALKDSDVHDGTAVTYFSKSNHSGIPVVVLDYEVLKIEADILEHWLPSVLKRCEELATMLRARQGSIGVFIEDKASGIALLQHAFKEGWNTYPIPPEITAMGKEGRALSVSGYVFKGMVKLSRYAYDKVVNYENSTKNHWLYQICGFRLGQKSSRIPRDLLDTFTSGLCLALGNSEGY